MSNLWEPQAESKKESLGQGMAPSPLEHATAERDLLFDAEIAVPVRAGIRVDRSPFSVRSTLCRARSLADHTGVAEIFSPTTITAIARAKPRPAAKKE